MADLSSYINISANTVSTGNLSATGTVTSNSVLSTTGNVTGNYFIGNGSQLTGLPATYGNSNVATFLSAYGSNTVVTTGNITGGNIISNNGAVVPGTANTGVNAVLAGPTFTPLANTSAGFVANVNNYTQVTFQNKNTGTDATADYILTADNGSDTVNYGDFGIINSGYDNSTPTNSLGNIVYAADTYLYAQGNTSNASQSGGNLVIGTTVPGKNVKIFAGGITNNSIVANISNTGVAVTGTVSASGNISTSGAFVGNGVGLTNVTVSAAGNIIGTSSNVNLVAGSYTMTFDNTGVATFPTIGGDEGGEINFGIPTSNTSLTTVVKLDVYQNRVRFFDGSAKGVYIDLSQAGASVSTLLNNRVSGFVNAGTFVTMDNIKATVTTSGLRGLSIAAVSGTFSYNIGGTYSTTSGTGGVSQFSQTATTTPSNSIFGWTFPNTSETSTYILTDTTNSRCYRITLMIGASYNNNAITIERLI